VDEKWYHLPMLLSEHQIGTGMSEADLNAASWWVKHRLGLRRLGYGSLIAFCVACWGFTLWSYADAYLISWPRESRIFRLIAEQTVPLEAFRRIAPEALQPTDVRAFEGTDSRMDLMSGLTNPNDLWIAHVKFAFKVGEQTTPPQEAVILPHSTRPLVELGWKGSGDPQLDVQSIQWQRVPLFAVNGNYDGYAAQRQDFIFSENPSYEFLGDNVGKTDFTVTNNSGYGYWNVQLFVTLLRQGVPLAVNKVDVRELKPNEVRPISLQWLENVGGVDQVEIVPYVDILDPASYLPTTRI
jgi:hypothetical protein